MASPMTIILPSWLITTPQQPPKPEHGVRVVGDRIDAVATNTDLLAQFPDDDVIDASSWPHSACSFPSGLASCVKAG